MAGPRFIADPAEATVAVALDGLIALYHRPSGATHILATPAPEILAALRQGPLGRDALLDLLSQRYALAGDAPAAVDARLAELEASGLVRRL
ncbi:MAG: HPr-rel-A system PqqD family peptide chaperone [Sphingomonadaceae bacterium]